MAESTGISWCDATFNGWVGCAKVSPGCAHCYAETLVTGRMNRPGTWGEDGVRERTSESNWKKPLLWNRRATQGMLPDGSENTDGHRPRVFCSSLADVFEPRPELEPWREDLFRLIEGTPALDWLVLTKRPEEAREFLARRSGEFSLALGLPPFPNLWLGVSIENSRFTWRADVLRQIPAAIRFISAEPLLGSLLQDRASPTMLDGASDSQSAQGGARNPAGTRAPLDLDGIDWVIVGGESGGRDARPMHPEWARELRDACIWGDLTPCGDGCCEPPWPKPAAFLFKQWGSYAPRGFVSGKDDIDERAFRIIPGYGATEGSRAAWKVSYYGAAPTAGGHVLDGQVWAEFPEAEVAVA